MVGLAGASISGFAAVHGAELALVALVPLVLSFLWRPAGVPRWVARLAPGTLRVALGSVFLMRVALTLYPVLDDDRVARVALVTGAILVPLLALAVLGTRVWAPPWAAVPLAIAVLAVASFDPSPRVRWAQIAEAVLAIVYLAVALPRVEPPGRRRTWSRAAAVLAFAAVAGGIALLLARLLPWAQPHVEDAAARLLNPSFPVAQAGFSANSRLGDIEKLALSRVVVLRVSTPWRRKLRGRVLTEFDGRSWHVPRPGWRDLKWAAPDVLEPDLARWLSALPGRSFGDPAAARRADVARTRVRPAIVVADTLFAPAGVALVHVAAPRVRADRFGILEAPGDPTDPYALVNGPPSAPADEPGLDTLALPADVDARLVALAASLSSGDPTPATRVARTCLYLARECRYSLDVGRFVSAQPVAEFVFDKKRGYCEYFASAAALLLRLQGVPARYVTGFSMDAALELGGHYVVRESDAHAWIEAWIPGRGWVEADPTPSAQYAALHGGRGSRLERQIEWLDARWAEAWFALKTHDFRGLLRAVAEPLGWLAAAGVLGAAFALWRRRERARPAVAAPPRWTTDAELGEVVARLESLWARHGCPRPPHRGHLEHLRHLPPGRLPPALVAASESVLASYYAVRYGGRAASRESVRALASALEEGA